MPSIKLAITCAVAPRSEICITDEDHIQEVDFGSIYPQTPPTFHRVVQGTEKWSLYQRHLSFTFGVKLIAILLSISISFCLLLHIYLSPVCLSLLLVRFL